MSDILEKTNIRFGDLGVSGDREIESLFRQIFDRANNEVNSVGGPGDLESFRVRWVGRKNSVFSRIQDNWLVPARSEEKRWVGGFFNSYKKQVEQIIEERMSAIEILENKDSSRGAWEVALSLPGAIRRDCSNHLIRSVSQGIAHFFFSIGFSTVEGAEI